MPSGYSVLEYQGDGVTTVFAVNFTLGYLNKSDIYCRVGDEVDGSGNPAYRVLESIPGDPGRMRVLGAVPTASQKVLFRRITSKTALQNDYTDGESLDDTALDDSFKQQLMIAHELLDGYGLSTVYSDINLSGHKITNVITDPNDPTSMCNVQYAGQAPLHSAAAEAAKIAAEAARDTSIAAKDISVQAAADSETARAAAVVAKNAAEAEVGTAVQISAFTGAWDMIVGSGPAAYIKKSFSEFWTYLTGFASGKWAKQQSAVVVSINGASGTVALDAINHQDVVIVTPASTVAFSNPTNGQTGMYITITLFSATAVALTWGDKFFGNEDGLPSTTTADKWHVLTFRCIGSNNWLYMGQSRTA